MKLSIYETLNIASDASETGVRVALRYLIKRLYRHTRDIGGDTEEGLRFANVTANILLNDKSRRQYNSSLSHERGRDISTRFTSSSVSSAKSSHVTRFETGGDYDVLDEPQTNNIEVNLNAITHLQQQSSPSRVFSLSAIMLSLCLSLVFFTQVYADSHWQSLLRIGLLHVFFLALLFAVLVLWSRKADSSPLINAPKLAELPIIKWRRERAIHMGATEIIEDQAWIYRLRVMEVERSKNQRTSHRSITRRVMARLIDLGIAALIALIGMYFLSFITPYASLLSTWWLLPLMATLINIPIEIAATMRFGTTFGKFLLGLMPMFAVTQLYNSKSSPIIRRLVAKRSLAVATNGLAFGLPFLWIIVGMSKLRQLSVHSEPKWDSNGDSIITQVPISTMQKGAASCVFAALVSLLLHTVWPSILSTTVEFKNLSTLTSKESVHRISQFTPSDLVPKDLSLTIPKIGIKQSDTRPLNEDINAFKHENLSSKKVRWEGWDNQFKQALNSGDMASMRGTCGKWAAEDYTNPRAFKCYGLALQANGDHNKAIEVLRQAQALDAKDTTIDQAISRSQLTKHGQ